MNITINVTGLEGLISILEKLVSVAPVQINAQEQSAASIPQAPITQIPPQQQAAIPVCSPVPVQTNVPVQVPPVQSAPSVQTQAPTVVPTQAQTYTMEQLAVAATQLVDAGRRQELVNLLTSFGVQALTALPKEQYGSFATQLRAMGAKI